MRDTRLRREAYYTPLQLCVRAFAHSSLPAFRGFLGLVPTLYELLDAAGPDRLEFLEILCSYPAEMVTLHHVVRKPGVAKFDKYVQPLLSTWNGILRRAFESGSEGDFDSVEQALTRLEMEARRTSRKDEESTEPDDVRQLSRLVTVLRFGFTAWLLDRTLRPRKPEPEASAAETASVPDSKDWPRFAKRCAKTLLPKLPSDPATVVPLFVEALRHDYQDIFQWGWWQKEDELSRGEAAYVGFKDELARLAVLLLLASQTSPGDHGVQPEATGLWRHVVSEDGPLAQAVNAVRDDPEAWEWLVPGISPASLDSADEMLAAIRTQVATFEESRTISAQLSAVRCAEFKSDVRKHAALGELRRTFAHFDAYKEHSTDEWTQQAEESPQGWGYIRFHDRRAFIDDATVSFSDLGGFFGRDLARSEDRRVFRDLLDAVAPPSEITSPSQLAAALGAAIDQLKSRGYDTICILGPYLALTRHLYEEEAFEPARQLGPEKSAYPPGIQGVLRHRSARIPILRRESDDHDRILVADLRSLAEWRQWREDDEELVDIEIVDLATDESERQRIRDQSPTYLKDKSPDEQERLLQLRVVLKILERFAIEIVEPDAGVVLRVPDE